MKKDKIAFFDICGTLYKENTTFAFIDSIETNYFKKYATNSVFFKIISAIIYKSIKFDILKKTKVYTLKNKALIEIERSCENFIKSELTKNNEVFDILNRCKKEGYRIVLISATIEPIAKSIANDIKSVDYYSTTLSTKQKKYLGTINQEIYLEKYNIISRILSEGNYDDSIFITDNKPDLRACQLCNKSIAVINNSKDEAFWIKNEIEVLPLYD